MIWRGGPFIISKSSSAARDFIASPAWASARQNDSVVAEIETSEPAYTHSFAMTERYLVLAEFPLVTKPLRLLFSGRPFIEILSLDAESRAALHRDRERYGRDRPAGRDRCVFCFSSCQCLRAGRRHSARPRCLPDARIIDALYLDALRAGKAVPRSALTRYTIPLGEGPVTQNSLGCRSWNCRASPIGGWPGAAYRYVWGTGQMGSGFLDSLVKQDLDTAATHDLERRTTTSPGEPVFVPTPRRRAGGRRGFVVGGARWPGTALFSSGARCRDDAGARAGLCAACHSVRLPRQLFCEHRIADGVKPPRSGSIAIPRFSKRCCRAIRLRARRSHGAAGLD